MLQSKESSSHEFLNGNMKKSNSELKDWEVYFLDRGIKPDLIASYLDYIGPLLKHNLPVIFEVEHLSKYLGLKLNVLNQMIYSPSHFYREFAIPKRKGGKRVISAPYPSLRESQRWILDNILEKGTSHYAAQGYAKTKSILTNAQPHVGKKALLKIDLKDFFPSIKIEWIINFFHKLGYAKNVSFALASLCCLDNALPQGSPASPQISNLLLKRLDMRLYRLSKKYSLTYTRYADDLFFSGEYIPHKLIEVIKEIIVSFGLNVNENKTTLLLGANKQKIVTGLAVHGNTLSIPRVYKRKLKQEVHYIKKFGLISHISKKKIRNPNYLLSLEGRLRFWLQVEPKNEFAKRSLDFILSLN